MPSARKFFSEAQQNEIVKAIRIAETYTSGELRIHLEAHCKGDVYNRALFVFRKLKMDATAERNGVLFYLAVADKQFAIVADEGINKKVHAHFWDHIKEGMQTEFSQGRFMEGLIQGIEQTAEQLKVHFPFSKNDSNELPNEISFTNE
ncbi:MAG: TPM domain-containing protein [Chitinophagales bacterium]